MEYLAKDDFNNVAKKIVSSLENSDEIIGMYLFGGTKLEEEKYVRSSPFSDLNLFPVTINIPSGLLGQEEKIGLMLFSNPYRNLESNIQNGENFSNAAIRTGYLLFEKNGYKLPTSEDLPPFKVTPLTIRNTQIGANNQYNQLLNSINSKTLNGFVIADLKRLTSHLARLNIIKISEGDDFAFGFNEVLQKSEKYDLNILTTLQEIQSILTKSDENKKNILWSNKREEILPLVKNTLEEHLK